MNYIGASLAFTYPALCVFKPMSHQIGLTWLRILYGTEQCFSTCLEAVIRISSVRLRVLLVVTKKQMGDLCFPDGLKV